MYKLFQALLVCSIINSDVFKICFQSKHINTNKLNTTFLSEKKIIKYLTNFF